MDRDKIFGHIDHTLLKPFAVWSDIEKLCREAVKYHTASVCIPPSFVSRVHDHFEHLTICTVVGFPLGYNTTQAKLAETKQALEGGADEVDMVVNICDVKDHQYGRVEAEIRALKEVCGTRILKVIVETCYLTPDEKKAMCRAVTLAGADYIKTSTGFGTAGATLDDIGLFKEHIGPRVKIKAAGGIRTLDELEAYMEAGCDRIGTSSAVELLTENGADV